jgi:hypothetical protein
MRNLLQTKKTKRLKTKIQYFKSKANQAKLQQNEDKELMYVKAANRSLELRVRLLEEVEEVNEVEE